MIKITFLVIALSTCPSSYATYYSSSESSSEIIGYSPDFQRLFPEFTSNSINPSSSFKEHKPEKPRVDSLTHVDGFTRSESHTDGFKLAKPALAGHSSPPGGSLQTSHHVAHTTRDDVLPFPSELSDFWTSQLIRTPNLQSTTSGSDRFREADNVVYSSSSNRAPSLQDPHPPRIGYNPRPVSDGHSHPEEETATDSDRFEARPVADGHSVLGSSQGTASRSR